MSVTISELAKQLNVSKGTVSRVLNGRPDVIISEATRRRIIQAAKELGYRPNRTARALATGSTGLIALQIEINFHVFHTQVAYRMETELARHPYQILISPNRLAARSMPHDLEVAQWPVDGIIVHEDFEYVHAYLQTHPSRLPPLVSTGAFFPRTPDVDYVGVDLTACSREAMEHLVSSGGTRISYLVNGPQDLTGDPRYDAYLAVLKEAGLKPEFIFAPTATRPDARQTVREYVRAQGCPNAIFCHNDDWAIGAYRGLRDLGVRIPDDVRLVSCDGVEDTEYFDPPISTIVQPIKQLCALAWTFLKNRMNDPSCPLQQVCLQPYLDIRGSSRV